MSLENKLYVLLVICSICEFSSCWQNNTISDIVAFFEPRNLKFYTILLCSQRDVFMLSKAFSAAYSRGNFVDLSSYHIKNIQTILDNYHPGTAVVLDTSCGESSTILQIGSANRLMDLKHHWLILVDQKYTLKEVEEAVHWAEPEIPDLQEYLDIGNNEMGHGALMEDFNQKLNEKVLTEIERANYTKNYLGEVPPMKLQELATLKAMADSEVVLAIPENDNFDLYDVHRLTNHSRMVVRPLGGRLSMASELNYTSSVLLRNNLHGHFVLSAMALLHFDYLSRSGEQTFRSFDVWAEMGLQMSQLVEEHLNYRMIIKCFDDYGWADGDNFTGMLRWYRLQKAEIGAAGMLYHSVRMPAVDYIHPNFEVKLGILFRVPTLSQVSNIFVLPFATDVWVSLLGLLIVTIGLLYFQLQTTKKIKKDFQSNDIFTFVTAATFQQGSDMDTTILSVRLTMLVFLVSTLFLYTSYSATIVTLLQTPSDKIHTVADLCDSSLGVGVQHVPYLVNLVKEDKDPSMRELLHKKVEPQNNYISSLDGTQRVRAGLFGFLMELSTGFRIINKEYTEREKCGLKILKTYPFKQHGPVVPKKAPLSEHLRQRYCWVRETGFLSRVTKRWMYQQPHCEQEGSGFANVGMGDMLPVFNMFFYGVALSVLVLFAEIIHFKWRSHQLGANNGQDFSNVKPFQKEKKKKIAFD